MAEIGSGNGTGYPSATDTDSTPESASLKTNYKVANDLGAAVIALETELGTNPSLNKDTVKTFLQVEHDDDGKHTLFHVEHDTAGKHTHQKVAHMFYIEDTAANQSAVAINVAAPLVAPPTEIEMPWSGSVVGISIISNEARSAGTLTVDATVNGTVTGLQAVLNGSNTLHHSAAQALALDTFSAGDRIGVKITTDSAWAPTTADIVVIVYVTFSY